MLGATIACWPTFLNRQPFLLSDTLTYIRGADAAVYRATGYASDWHARYQQRFEPLRSISSHETSTARPVILSGRSIYYGAFLYAAYLFGGLRLAAFIQALLAVTCLYMTLRRFLPRERSRRLHLLLLVGALSFVSSLGFFTSYLVPDLFAAFAILVAAHLLSSEPPLSSRDKAFWLSILCLSSMMHSSILLIIAIVVAVMSVCPLLWRTPGRQGIALVCLGLFAGLSGEAIYYKSVEMAFGDPPVRPPFVMARLIADGPGVSYLRDHCPQSSFALCRYADRVPATASHAYSDAFLWSADPKVGVFSAVDFDERRRIAAEETSFVFAVVVAYPFEVLKSTLGAVGAQATKWRLTEFNLNSAERNGFAAELPAEQMRAHAQSLAFDGRMPVGMVETTTLPVALLSAGWLLWLLSRRKTNDGMRLFAGILLLGTAADIIVCGTASTPHDRYLMRVAWLIPLGAYLCIAFRGPSLKEQIPAIASQLSRTGEQSARSLANAAEHAVSSANPSRSARSAWRGCWRRFSG